MGAKAPGARHIRGLSELARLHGVQSAYKDAFGQRRVASAESVLAALSALGAPLERGLDVGPALKERRQELWSRLAEPVIVAWQGRPAEAELRLPADRSEGKVTCRLELEDGEARSWSSNLSQALISTRAEVGGRNFLSRRLALPGGLPLGYHRLTVEAAGRSCSPLLISAPRRAWWGPPGVEGRIWGVFMPLYALRSKDDWGVGDFGDLESLLAWVGELGGSVVGTLPLLAAFLDEPYDESPYAPASRLFWNDLFVDLTAAPELGSSPEAASLLSSTGVAAEIEALRMKELVDYRRVAALKRRVGELLAEALHTSPARASGRYEAFRRFVDSSPGVARYARFRAECELRRSAWQAWPSPEREGVLSEREGVEERRRYHLYVQWLAHEQLDHLSARAPGPGGGLYLDLPVGVHQASYDTWAERDAFVLGVSAGSPPDRYSMRGQVWGFPPLHPERIRRDGYRYPLACLRHLLRHAGALRIDHVMGLHRLFWVPHGLPATEGVYVRYPAEELYALLALESNRSRAVVIGEDLGTVPGYVRKAMASHGIYRSYVVQHQLRDDPGGALPPAPPASLAALNTHDMPPFTAFLEQLDISQRVALEVLRRSDAAGERAKRRRLRAALVEFLRAEGRLGTGPPSSRRLTEAVLAQLAAGSARVVVSDLEDLWLETRPQNMPATHGSHPNWRRKARHSFEEFRQAAEVMRPLGSVSALRREVAPGYGRPATGKV